MSAGRLSGRKASASSRAPRKTPSTKSTQPWQDKLSKEQRHVLSEILGRPGTLLIGDVGSGKTIVSMALIERQQPQYTIIVAPLTSLDVTWAPRLDTLPGTLVCRSWEEFKQCRHDIRFGYKPAWRLILLVHFQLFSKITTYTEKVPWDLAIIDESQGLKDRASGQSRAGRRLRHAARRLALTGTPLDRDPIEVWGQMRFVHVDLFGEDFNDFAAEFCVRGGFKDKKFYFRKKKIKTFLALCKPYVSRLTKDFMQLKPMTVYPVGVPLLGEQARIYNAMAKQGIVKVNGSEIAALLAVTRQGKLEQITGGTIKDEYGTVYTVGSAKLRKLAVLLKKLPKPVVIFCKYLAEIDLIQSVLPKQRVAVLNGRVKDTPREKVRTNLINSFQEGKVDYLVCQTRTGGVSIELTRSCNLVFYSMNFSLIDFEQIIGRFHRGGQTEPVSVWVLFAADTVDTQIIDDIDGKKATFYEVVDYFTPPSSSGASGDRAR